MSIQCQTRACGLTGRDDWELEEVGRRKSQPRRSRNFDNEEINCDGQTKTQKKDPSFPPRTCRLRLIVLCGWPNRARVQSVFFSSLGKTVLVLNAD